MIDIKPMLGICTQFNVLHGDLSVEEHAIFYAKVSFVSDRE